jgi:hypothetical protein
MDMRRALVTAITLASTAALVSGATVTAAQASQHSAAQHAASQHSSIQHSSIQHSSIQHSSIQHSTSSGREEHFRIISTSAASRRQSVLATGAFTAGGYQVPGRVVSLRSTDKMVFPGGTFQVARHITSQWLPLPTSACLVRETLRGTYSLSHGTGSYVHISGTGAFVLRIRGVIRKTKGKCGGSMTVIQQITYAGGAVRS